MEKKDYRINLEQLLKDFPEQRELNMKEAEKYLRKNRRTLLKDSSFPIKKLGNTYLIPLTGLARWMSA